MKPRFTTFAATRRVIRGDLGLTPIQKLVLLVMVDAANVWTAQVHATQAEMARDASLSVRHVGTVTRELEAMGLVTTYRERDETGKNRRNVYTLEITRIFKDMETATTKNPQNSPEEVRSSGPEELRSDREDLRSEEYKNTMRPTPPARTPRLSAAQRTLDLWDCQPSGQKPTNDALAQNQKSEGATGATTIAATPSAAKRSAVADANTLLGTYKRLYEDAFGFAPAILPKHRAIAKQMVAAVGLERAQSATTNAFADDWFRSKSGDLSVVYGQLNKYMHGGLATQPGAAPVAPSGFSGSVPSPATNRRPRRVDPGY